MAAAKQTELNTKVANAKDVEQKTQMFNFDGEWLPSVDAALIGAKNYRTLTNMRYTEGGIEGVNGYFDFNATAITTYVNINSGIHFRTNRTDDSYIIVHASDASGNGVVRYSTSAVGIAEGTGAFSATALHTDASADLTGRFSNGPSGVVAYCNQEESLIWEGTEADIMTLFTTETADVDDASAFPVNETEVCLNRIVADAITIDDTDRFTMCILSTAPLQGIKLYVDPDNANTAHATTNALAVEYWNGTAFVTCTTIVDGTTKLSTTGTITFDSTAAVAKAKHYQERFAYAYTISLTVASASATANIYQVTVDKPMQAPTNIWDGIYRQPIQVQRYTHSNTSFEDFTVHVREASTVELPVGLFMGQLVAADHILIMFSEPMSAIKLTMLGSLVNVANAQFDATDGIQYWNGSAWANTTFTDGTLDTGADSSCSQTGLLSWNPPTDEEETQLFGTIGYAYKITVDGTFTGASDNAVTVDFVTGIPAQQAIKTFKFATQYKNKLLMCGYSEGNEGNRIDYCVDNNPHMWNGSDSSNNGNNSIYVGSVEELTAGVQLYNRIGSNLFSMLALLKNNEVWLMVGDSPIDYKLYPISFTIGCPAPGTLCTSSIVSETEGVPGRNIAVWISHQGPVMFDGSTISTIPGLEKYFDPNDSDSINWTYLKDAKGWFDSTYEEWNILLAGNSATTLDTWFVYDVKRQRWFKKSTGTGQNILCGIQCVATDGDQYIYGGAGDGRLYELETGASWNGSSITYIVHTGDFFPTNNPWDISILRRIKLVAERLTESGASISIDYYSDTSPDAGVSIIWQDVTAAYADSATAGLTWTDVTAALADSGTAGLTFYSVAAELFDMSSGADRLVRLTRSMNNTAWAHSIKFEFSSTESAKGFVPIFWGVQTSLVRLDQ